MAGSTASTADLSGHLHPPRFAPLTGLQAPARGAAGGGWLTLGRNFASPEGAALAADRASIAVWGREGAAEQRLLNWPLEEYTAEERQLFGPELGDFLPQLR